MFERGLFNRGRIRSDEGFEVTFVGRSQLVYVEKGRQVTISGELLRDGFAAATVGVKTWDDGSRFIEGEWPAIQDRVTRAHKIPEDDARYRRAELSA
jgi:hypothetical protein